jgi:iron complex outermembrane receptor protein
VTIGNFGTTNFSGMVNIPVSDTVAIRLAVQTNKHDAYSKGVQGPTGAQYSASGASGKDDLDDESYRFSITVKPTKEIESTTYLQHYKMTGKGPGWRLGGVNPTGAYGATVAAALQNTLNFYNGQDWHTVVNDQKLGDSVEANHLSNTTTWELNDSLTLKNVIGWRSVSNFTGIDFDGSAVLFSPTAPSGPITAFNSLNDFKAHQFSEEFQLLGKAFDNRLDWIGGVYYFREMGNDIQRSDLFGRRINDGTGENKSRSVFGQGTYKFESMKDLSVTAGWRKTWDDRTVDQHQQLMGAAATTFSCRLTGPSGALNPCSRVRNFKDSAPSWGVTFDYQLAPDTMAYVARRKGYRSGGVQLRANAFTEPAYFAPESVMDWELGLKSSFKLGSVPVRTNVALFSQQYKNMQRTVSVPTAVGLVTTVFSAGEAQIKGGELELTVLPTDNLELGAFASLTDGKYKTFTQRNSNGRNGGFDDLSGSKLSMIPRNVYGLSARYRLPLASDIGKVSAKVNVYRQSDMQITDINNNATNPIAWPGEGTVKGYHLVDASIDWTQVMGNPFDLRFYVKNLSDEKYATGGVSVISTGLYAYTLGAPRTYGLELRYRFGTEK